MSCQLYVSKCLDGGMAALILLDRVINECRWRKMQRDQWNVVVNPVTELEPAFSTVTVDKSVS